LYRYEMYKSIVKTTNILHSIIIVTENFMKFKININYPFYKKWKLLGYTYLLMVYNKIEVF
ncbi:hypothetical protein ACYZFO_16560, partial [Clostridioides difficile]